MQSALSFLLLCVLADFGTARRTMTTMLRCATTAMPGKPANQDSFFFLHFLPSCMLTRSDKKKLSPTFDETTDDGLARW